ncbi:zinc finger BED domain-containing protein 1-like [Acyrthosiphon pisum]|uniref:BED-type domain-containing protein n=1 Tax=Acyrthosiphon pisum TaxID=7029 RepID=A0A8R2B3Z0_ACYPI|nr:zinc finger BED domain-containing protein 1-like [Acyrthosiphon pisum]|eukprot:XP_008180283.1 PREDICTED: zinc finger BED domain-containing protein 1-like [Acyrthosiphon pisum]
MMLDPCVFSMSPPRSKAWNCFKKKNGSEAICKVCSNIIKYSGNTSNLFKHLKKHSNLPLTATTVDNVTVEIDSSQAILNRHLSEPIEPSTSKSSDTSTNLSSEIASSHTLEEEMVDSPLPAKLVVKRPIVESFNRASHFQEGGYRHSKITMSLLYFICKDKRPFHVIDGKGFQHLLKELSPSYKIPCATTLKQLLDNKYDVMKQSLKKTLLKSFCLSVIELKEQHTGDYISKILNQTLEDWEIEKDNVVTIVTDNGSNMISAVNKTFKKIDGKSRHIPCFAHTINLVVEVAVNHSSVNNLISMVREIVKWVKRSVKNSDCLRKSQMDTGIPEGSVIKLILDVKTRWNSTFYMIERFLKIVDLISPMLLRDCSGPSMLSAYDIEALQQLVRLLKPLEHVTKESSGEKYVTISKIIPMINCLVAQLNNIKPSTDSISDVQVTLLREINKRFGSIELVTPIAISTLLDPRFKNLHFHDANACSKAMSTLRKMMNNDLVDTTTTDTLRECDAPTTETYHFWNHHESLALGQKTNRPNYDGIINDELSLYLTNPVVPLITNPLEKWEELKNIFPLLYKQARIHFAMVATSVPCERLFSKAGATITNTRNRLTGKRLEKLLFLGCFDEEDWF